MASSGKGKRRVKGKTLDLSSFLGDQNTPTGFAVVTPRRDWADCVEEESDDRFPTYRKEEKIVLPTAPKAARGPDFDVSKIPSQPPFTAFVGNLPYDIMDEDIMRFFGNLKVISVRLPRDGGDRGRMRGFGYAEFEDKQSLIEALSLNGETLKNRPIKVSLAGEHENERGDRKNDGIDRTAGDWRAAPKEDSFSSRSDRQRNGAFGNRYDDGDREPYRGRSSFDNDMTRNYEDSDRQPYQGRRSYEREREYGFGRDKDRDRYSREGDQGFSDRDRGYNRRYGDRGFDSYERDRGYDRGARSSRRDDDFEPRREDDREREPPKERPRLQLKPRTATDQPAAPPVQTSSIFGGAKPVDTAAKEREIEKRLAKEKEKHDDLDKPRFSQSQPSRYTNTRGLSDDRPPSSRRDWDKKSDSESREEYRKSDYSPPRRYADESYSRDARLDLSDSESRERESRIQKYSKDDIHSSAVEQQDEEVSFLANKFAHLSNQEEIE